MENFSNNTSEYFINNIKNIKPNTLYGNILKNELFNPNDSLKPESIRLLKISNKNLQSTTQSYKSYRAKLKDDFYCNLLDWSSNGFIAIGIENQIFLINTNTNQEYLLFKYFNDNVTCVCFNKTGSLLCIGTVYGQTDIYDIHLMKLVKRFNNFDCISSISWSGHYLTTSAKNATVVVRDIRTSDEKNYIHTNLEYCCSVKWSPNNNFLAIGGNNDRFLIWSVRKNSILYNFDFHNSAVKALAWSPDSKTIVSGGGVNDKTIKFTYLKNGHCFKTIYTGSQVCNLFWNKNNIISTHGFSSNDICSWNTLNFRKVSVFKGHTSRVIYSAQSGDGNQMVTGAGGIDNSIRFWDLHKNKKIVDKKLFNHKTFIR